MKKNEIQNIKIEKIKPLVSIRRLAELFDCYTDKGTPATDTILDWWHRGKIPPPDCKISRKAIYWKYETIKSFIDSGGYCEN